MTLHLDVQGYICIYPYIAESSSALSPAYTCMYMAKVFGEIK